jgi:hypothetical protein
MLGAGHLSLSTAGGGGNSTNLSYFTQYSSSYSSNSNTPVPIAGLTGDLIFLFVGTNNTGGTVTGLTGWNSIYFTTFTAGGNATYQRAYWKVKTPSDTTLTDTMAGWWQVIYRPQGTVTGVTISSITSSGYSASPSSTHTLTMPSSGIYIGFGRYSMPSAGTFSAKNYSITPTRQIGSSQTITGISTWENLTGATPIATTTFSGIFSGGSAHLGSFVAQVNLAS